MTLSEAAKAVGIAAEILNGKKDFTVDQIRLLRHRWGIPADCLIGELPVA